MAAAPDATAPTQQGRPSALRDFLASEAAGGIVLMGAAALAMVVANSTLAGIYAGTLKAYVGPLSVLHWINDGLMALFFLLVGLEIKREILDGQLSSGPRRILPGIAAAGGMVVPAAIYLAFNASDPATLRGWAVPTATDIAFALGVLALLGKRVPATLKIFLTALAIIDDLGAVLIIAVFYTADLSMPFLAASAAILAALVALNRTGIVRLSAYLLLGGVLWICVLGSGVHATIAGVMLALSIPCRPSPGRPDDAMSPLHILEHALHKPVAFAIVPIFGFANAGVSLGGASVATLLQPLPLGIALGLVLGKLIGVFGSAMLAIRLGLADLPAGASRVQLLGVALLCGIGFTMSLFIGLLAFPGDDAVQDKVKIGILMGSCLAGLAGWTVLRFARRRIPAVPASQSGPMT